MGNESSSVQKELEIENGDIKKSSVDKLLEPSFVTLDGDADHEMLMKYYTYFRSKNATDYAILTGEYGCEEDIMNEYYCVGNSTNSSIFYGLRPVFKFENITDIIGNTKIEYDENNIGVFEYGYYPKSIVEESTRKKLDEELRCERLNILNKKIYTSNKTSQETAYIGDNQKFFKFEAEQNKVYELDGELYVRVANKDFKDNSYLHEKKDKKILNNGEKIELHKHYWVKIEPIEWYLFSEFNTAITKDIIIGGMNVYDKNIFDEEVTIKDSNIYKFLEEYFSKEIYQFGINKDLKEITFAEKKDNLEELRKKDNVSDNKKYIEKYRNPISGTMVIVHKKDNQIDESDKIIDVDFTRPYHFNIQEQMFESYTDTEINIKIKDKTGEIKEIRLASCMIPEIAPDKDKEKENKGNEFYENCSPEYLT